ncbi:MAG: phosphoribosylglycinamide formyltransferase [Chlorobia bacterium]|nr:phosphoribosylglycinamide formyltransferase [Fimbriimonadaceae bacterium]
MGAIVSACQTGEIPATVDVVVAPKSDLVSVKEAKDAGVPVVVVPPSDEGYGEALLQALGDTEVLCLAGYLRLIPTEVLQAYPNPILNVHPALLPKFGGKGMYGMHVHEAVLAAGETESGATVHLVSEHYDEGRILVQRRCPVHPDDTPESLAERVLAEEHRAYIEALRQVLGGGGTA